MEKFLASSKDDPREFPWFDSERWKLSTTKKSFNPPPPRGLALVLFQGDQSLKLVNKKAVELLKNYSITLGLLGKLEIVGKIIQSPSSQSLSPGGSIPRHSSS